MHQPLLQRIRRRPVPPAAVTTQLPGGAVALDLGPLFAQLDWQELLRQAGLRGRV